MAYVYKGCLINLPRDLHLGPRSTFLKYDAVSASLLRAMSPQRHLFSLMLKEKLLRSLVAWSGHLLL